MNFSDLGPTVQGGRKLLLCLFKVPTRFSSPAADHIESHFSMDEVLKIRAPHVYLLSITGESMQGAGIFEGDLAVVERSLEPAHGHIVVALLNNDPVCKRLCIANTAHLREDQRSDGADEKSSLMFIDVAWST